MNGLKVTGRLRQGVWSRDQGGPGDKATATMMEEEVTLPSPTDTPYRTPSSPRSQVCDDISPATTPPPIPEEYNSRRRSADSLNPALDNKISPLDPRRFTPTLHASLVSEILSLRRDLEHKTDDIEKLEQSLHQSHQQNETLNANLLNSNKQTREVKRQMQLLEGGTLSAITDLSKERDDARNDFNDLRRRLEQSQKRVKGQEEQTERTQHLWNKERDAWLAEKRGLETKAQIAEGRLKVVLSEVANIQANDRPHSPVRRVDSRSSMHESPSRGPRRNRRHSANSINSDHAGGRMSVLSFANGVSFNLADELAFDEEEEEHMNEHLNDIDEQPEDGRVSPDALPEEQHEGPQRPSSSLSLKARKVLGMPLDLSDKDAKEMIDPVKTVESPKRASADYVDQAIQFSPPSSPPPPRTETRSDTRTDSRSTRHSRPADLQLNRQSVISSGLGSPQYRNAPASPTESLDTDCRTDSRYDSRYAPWNNPGVIMVSSSCQTIEILPTPPLTPEKTEAVLATIHESEVESVEMTTTGTQTEPMEVKVQTQKGWHHTTTDSGDLRVPLINIIPPTSRPATPDTAVVLPPRTKNAGMQVNLEDLNIYRSAGMQTEEIRVDRRNIMPFAQMPLQSAMKGSLPARAGATLLKRKPSPSASVLNSQRMNMSASRVPPTNDNGPLKGDGFGPSLPRPVRGSSLFQGFDDEGGEYEDDKFETDTFTEDDIFTRPTAKFTLNRGKLMSQDTTLEDIGESDHAASAGEAAAMDNLRQSEDSLPPDMKKFFAQGRNTPPNIPPRQAPAPKNLRRVPSAKSNNMRRAALISSGSAAHRATGSQSTNASTETSQAPFPVPLRYSSARIGKSVSEGGRTSRGSSNASPTKMSRLKGKHILRKSRSGPAISPHAQNRKSRSRSPPLESRVSIVPEMPTFQMPPEPPAFLNEPYDGRPTEASAPRPSIATGPNRKATHIKTNSDAVSMHQTSVVDSIAQTMVGEWMYKYVRRRKSFGMTDRTQDLENKSIDEISTSVTHNGVRHKRWVWLAPYERAVMWSSKQPTSGSALMGGKSGRKLTIKSVLDVKDDNPMPKGSTTGPQFSRSILILTPQRALKFTATSQERHFVWLTALSFLSHSPLSVNDLTAGPPPLPPGDQIMQPPPPPSLTGSFRRRPIRDSIRIAKGSARPYPGLRSFTTDSSFPGNASQQDLRNTLQSRDYYDPTTDPALPPTIKRFHSRKRSNTAPRAPPTSFRGFTSRDIVKPLPDPHSSSVAGSTAITSTNGSDRGLYTPSLGMPSGSSSRRGSEASNTLPPLPPQLSMDAFIDHQRPGMLPPISTNRGGFIGGAPSGSDKYNMLRSGTLKKKEMGYWGIEDGRGSISPVDSLMHAEMMAAGGPGSGEGSGWGSVRGSAESRRDPFKGF